MSSLALRRSVGAMLNVFRVPGFLRPSICENRLGIPVEVTVDKMFTVIHVREVKLFFSRVSGRFDGVALDGDTCEQSPPR